METIKKYLYQRNKIPEGNYDEMKEMTEHTEEEENQLVTRPNAIEIIRYNPRSRWGGIQQYFSEGNLEKKGKTEEKNAIQSIQTNFQTNTLSTKTSLTGDGYRWWGIQQYFQGKSQEKGKTLEGNVTKEINSWPGGNEFATKSSIIQTLRESVGSRWLILKQYVHVKRQDKREQNGEIKTKGPTIYSSSPGFSGHSLTKMSQVNLDTAEEEEIQAKKIHELNNVQEKTVINALEYQNRISLADSGEYLQNQTIWETASTTEEGLEGTWKVGCELRMTVATGYEFRWKVKLKLKPPKKLISIQQLIQTASKIPDSQQHEVLDIPRKYKIVFVGDSGVGKTSFIRRYCNNTFRSSFHSTVGVDYREKEVHMDRKLSVLQLWDTAGQERFQSICTQYYRNADAVIAIYDVTCEESFKNIRRWMDNIKEITTDSRLMLLIGNKIDAIDFKLNNAVKSLHGAHLAEEYGALFFETSVKYDENITEAMAELIKLLEKRIQQEKKQLTLEAEKIPEKKCC